jgi:glucuronoarabinoxylan endo-1,4-beta-xylanase
MQVSDDTTAWKNELPIAKYASEKGAIVFASPWNAPAYMRIVRGTYNNETDYKLLEEFYDDYAEHLNRFIAFMAANSVPLYAISIQNEPDWHGWTTWTRDEMIKFLRENAQTIQCKIIAPESYGYSRSFINPLLNDSLANSRIDILGTHIYGTSKSDYYYPLAYEKGKEIWMTEHLLGSDSPQSNNWIGALQLADEINTCMDANMSAYVYWYIRRFYGLIDDAGNITDKGYVMSHFSKFIRPNSERIGLQMPNILKVSKCLNPLINWTNFNKLILYSKIRSK